MPVFGILLGFFFLFFGFSSETDKKAVSDSPKSVAPVVSPVSAPSAVVFNNSVKNDVKSSDSVSSVKTASVSSFGYDLISIAYNDVHDLTKIKFNYLLNGSIKTIGLSYFVSQGVKFVSRGICTVDLIAKDGQKLSLNCETPVIASCSVSIKSDSVVSYRGCLTVNQIAQSKSSDSSVPMLAGSFLK